MKKYRIAAVPGDGIGHEIVPAGIQLLEEIASRSDFVLEIAQYPWGAGYYHQHGEFLPPDGLDILSGFDAVFFGAVGLPEVDDTLPFKLYTNLVRTSFKQYVNLRPVKLFDGIASPLRNKSQSDIDFVIIRENNEGEFVQSGRQVYPERPEGMALDTSIFTRQGTERIAHYAFKLARNRKGKLTNVTKSNTLIHTLGFWDQVIREVADQYPDVEYQKMYVDAASANFVLHPEYFDVILTTNMIGDILSDLGGAIMGSLGLGGSGNINPDKSFPSMFEPIHGSAPDIAGKGWANPIGQFWSAALMLDHLGETAAAALIMKAINSVTAAGLRTRDLGGIKTNFTPADSILLRTGWSTYIGTQKYRNSLPRISRGLAEWCVAHHVKMLGVEAPSVADVNNLEEVTMIHEILLGGEVIILEGLCQLDQIRSNCIFLQALPIKTLLGDGAPARVIAWEKVKD